MHPNTPKKKLIHLIMTFRIREEINNNNITREGTGQREVGVKLNGPTGTAQGNGVVFPREPRLSPHRRVEGEKTWQVDGSDRRVERPGPSRPGGCPLRLQPRGSSWEGRRGSDLFTAPGRACSWSHTWWKAELRL